MKKTAAKPESPVAISREKYKPIVTFRWKSDYEQNVPHSGVKGLSVGDKVTVAVRGKVVGVSDRRYGSDVEVEMDRFDVHHGKGAMNALIDEQLGK